MVPENLLLLTGCVLFQKVKVWCSPGNLIYSENTLLKVILYF
jgi:hypothetical protein